MKSLCYTHLDVYKRQLYIIFSIAFMLITLLVILIAKPSTGLGEVLVTINLLNALVWLAINLVNRLRERLVSHRDQH
ncbi:inner membrane protein YmgF [Escherichia coli]|uniref:cell division-associated protein YmgF n=1 Tax=Escherichia coli TaxID=562 RepID=UPI000B3BA35E|nr:cell division-associated protein YmgF [Escherichia coli]OUR41590.1 inner membrane protein YmgF [Escherichia coli]